MTRILQTLLLVMFMITPALGSYYPIPLPGTSGNVLKSNGTKWTSGSITSTGTITSGTWNGTAIGLSYGGTGQTTKAAAFDALSPMTTSGDIIYGGASGTGTRLAKGSDGDVLTLAAGVPSWAAPGGISNSSITGQTAETSVAMASDLVLISDTSAAALRKMTPDNLIGGVRPVVYASATGGQSIGSSSATKVQLNNEPIDSNGNFDNATNYRFTPTVTGYYTCHACIGFSATVDTAVAYPWFKKNGTDYARMAYHASTNKLHGGCVSAIMYMNGSTDYVELFAFQDTGSNQNLQGDATYNFMMCSRIP